MVEEAILLTVFLAGCLWCGYEAYTWVRESGRGRTQ